LAGLTILVVNAGSTSLKLSIVARDDSSEAVDSLEAVTDGVDAVAHRVVHGGERFRDAVVVDDTVERELAALTELAPLHNRPALAALADARRLLPDVPHVAVFDTAFHATIPPEAATYAVPQRWRDEWGIRRYGFHGLSVEWAARRVPVPRLVVCHLGGGCSVTAVRGGRSVDTTMGFSPLEGVPMATRSGSIDPGALLYLLRERLLTERELEQVLEHESGLAGLSGGGAGDVRQASQLAVDVFVHRVAGAVASMAAACGGIDVLAFTGGIGEHAENVREGIVERTRFLGDFPIVVVPAREELVIAAETRRLLQP
jgi:acetate kinase